jgi:hypothetical protein
MQSATFRKWLAERGCRFDHHEHKRGEGHVLVTVHRGGRKSEVPLGGSRQDLDPRDVRRAARNSGSIGLNCLTSEPGVVFTVSANSGHSFPLTHFSCLLGSQEVMHARRTTP